MFNNRNEVNRWFRDKGETKRLEYPLTPDSIVVDLGGFRGEFANAIYKRFGCTVHVYEPVSDFYKTCVETNKANSKVTVYPLAIGGTQNGVLSITVSGDGSSTFKDGAKKENIRIVPANSLFDGTGLSLSHIDLLKINVEGGEYDILPALIESGAIKKIGNIQVQFHNFVDDAENRRKVIREKLAETHKLTFDYAFVWENWQLK